MSQITMTILDARRVIRGQPHGSFADAVVAALSAEPETIEELEAALARFLEPGERGPLAFFGPGVEEEPFDVGICLVDLAARLVVRQSTYSLPGPTGQVLCRGREPDAEAWVSYHLSDDWVFSGNVEGWRGLAEPRRRQRLAQPPLDAREALYGRVCEFIVEECFAARGDAPATGEWTPPPGWALRALPERGKPDTPPAAEDAVAEIHARWLTTPREDLRGQAPRDLLLAKREYLAWDLQDRSEQWTMQGGCPPGLSPESAAFRFGGFGTHENVLYYDLVRDLIWDCWYRVVEPKDGGAAPALNKADELARLRQIQDEWLAAPNLEDLSGHTPAEVIQRERQRIPMAVSGEEAMVDDDCPLCQMLAEGMGPVFWNLDGCNMDQDFPFSFHRTRQEWDEEQRQWEESSRRFEDERKQRQAAGEQDELPWEDDEVLSPWQSSFSGPHASHEPPSIRLFGIGARVAELGLDLKASSDTAPLVESLNRQFGNLRTAVGDPSASLVEPVVERFCQELHTVAEARPELAAKCADLERQLREFAADASSEGEWGDIPF